MKARNEELKPNEWILVTTGEEFRGRSRRKSDEVIFLGTHWPRLNIQLYEAWINRPPLNTSPPQEY